MPIISHWINQRISIEDIVELVFFSFSNAGERQQFHDTK